MTEQKSREEEQEDVAETSEQSIERLAFFLGVDFNAIDTAISTIVSLRERLASHEEVSEVAKEATSPSVAQESDENAPATAD